MNEAWDKETMENWNYKMSIGLEPITVPEEEAEKINKYASHISNESLKRLRDAGII